MPFPLEENEMVKTLFNTFLSGTAMLCKIIGVILLSKTEDVHKSGVCVYSG